MKQDDSPTIFFPGKVYMQLTKVKLFFSMFFELSVGKKTNVSVQGWLKL